MWLSIPGANEMERNGRQRPNNLSRADKAYLGHGEQAKASKMRQLKGSLQVGIPTYENVCMRAVNQ